MFRISIHTSAREVTSFFQPLCQFLLISIHTSAREVTAVDRMDMPEALDFNPHFRKGSDKKNEQRDVKQGNFNPHFRKGSDL